jgi:integrase
LDPELVRSLIEVAVSWRDTSILLLLATTGQRIGDWSDEHGRHGILGMSLADLDRRRSAIVVRLKGARDEHRVPVVAEFWKSFDRYLAEERRDSGIDAAWVGLRRGRGRPLSYGAFEASLRYAAAKAGVKVTAHMFRHTVAQHVSDTSGLKVAQELLGHQHISTTADIYAHVDHAAMVQAVAGLETRLRAPAAVTGRSHSGEVSYAFHYDASTIEELDAIATPRPVPGERP